MLVAAQFLLDMEVWLRLSGVWRLCMCYLLYLYRCMCSTRLAEKFLLHVRFAIKTFVKCRGGGLGMHAREWRFQNAGSGTEVWECRLGDGGSGMDNARDATSSSSRYAARHHGMYSDDPPVCHGTPRHNQSLGRAPLPGWMGSDVETDRRG